MLFYSKEYKRRNVISVCLSDLLKPYDWYLCDEQTNLNLNLKYKLIFETTLGRVKWVNSDRILIFVLSVALNLAHSKCMYILASELKT